MAPMVLCSELAYRMLVRNYGIEVCYSPMLRASLVMKGYQELVKLYEENYQEAADKPPIVNINTCSTFINKLFHMPDVKTNDQNDTWLAFGDYHLDDIPKLVIQLCGNDPQELAQATAILLEYYTTTTTTTSATTTTTTKANREADTTDKATSARTTILGIDLNLGCPQACARKEKFGAFLAEDCPDLALECVQAMRQAMDEYRNKYSISCQDQTNHSTDCSMKKPSSATFTTRLSCKIRPVPGESLSMNNNSDRTTLEYAQSLVDAGCELIAIHCRDRTDKNYGNVEWQIANQLVTHLDVPVVVNGGICSMECAHEIVTNDCPNVAGVMIAQGLLENPRMLSTMQPLIEDGIDRDENSQNYHICDIASEYLEFAEEYGPISSPFFLRRHLRWIFRKQLQSATTKCPQKSEYKSNWRAQLWTFLVRPYLTHIDQFRMFIMMYVDKCACQCPDRLVPHKQRLLSSQVEDCPITFSTIKKYTLKLVEEEETK